MEKKRLWIVLFLVVFIIFACILFLVSRNLSQKNVVTSPLSTSVMSETTIPSPTATVTLTPTALPGDIWVVMSIEENAIHANGFYYDVATFFNLDQPSLTIRAQCMDPGWPSPEIGHQFILIDSAVLAPIEGVESTIQRFLVLEGQYP